MTMTYKRNLGLGLIVINAGYLLFAVFTGRMEGLGGFIDMFTGLHDVPTTLAQKPFAFLFGAVGHAAITLIGIKFLREGIKDGA
jgi:hypothetical protein